MGSLIIILNGEKKQTSAINILQLINELGLKVDHIIIELNSKIIPSKDIPNTPLNSHDNVEIIRYIGGGS